MGEARITIVVLSYNRREELLCTLERLARNAAGWPVVVVDNGSSDGSAQAVAGHYAQHTLIRAPGNLGAAGRNLGVAASDTDYVAFCDDDVSWLPGSLMRAQQILDQFPDVAVLSAQVLVGALATPDPACQPMAHSPLAGEPGVGPALVGYMAGACVMRRNAFLQAGGYWPPLFIGGEEALLALDLLAAGWRILYAPALSAQHWPSVLRDVPERRRLLARNAIWLAWLRLPWRQLAPTVWRTLHSLPGWRARARVLADTWRGWPELRGRRRVIQPQVQNLLATVRKAGR